jgi:hypothetical protein
MYVQQATTGAPFQGLYVNMTGKLSGLSVPAGSRLKAIGVYHERFGESWLTGAQFTLTTAAPTPPIALAIVPSDVAVAGARLEGLLVAVDGVAITDISPDAAALKTFEFLITGGVRVDDYVYPRYGTCLTMGGMPCPYPPTAFGTPNAAQAYAVGNTFTRISGVLGYSFGKHKIYPRNGADLAFP